MSGSSAFFLGLGDCDTAATSKVIYDLSTGRFSCGTDQNSGGSSNWSNTGSLQLAFDARYLRKSGDTATGTLVVVNGKSLQVAATISGTTLKILGTGSGNIFHAEKTLSSSGTLVFEGAASGSSLFLGSSLEGAGLSNCSNGTTSKLLWSSATKRF